MKLLLNVTKVLRFFVKLELNFLMTLYMTKSKVHNVLLTFASVSNLVALGFSALPHAFSLILRNIFMNGTNDSPSCTSFWNTIPTSKLPVKNNGKI